MSVIRIVQAVFVYYAIMNYQVDSKISDKEYRLMPKLFHLDDFDDCMDLGEKALYCAVTVQLGLDKSQNKSDIWNIIQDVISQPRYYRHDKLRHGICVPVTCPNIEVNATDINGLKNGLSRCFTSKYEHLGLKAIITKLHCETDQEYYPIDNYDIAVGISLGILISLVVLASVYEGRARYKSKEEYNKIVNTKAGRIIACFSLPKNWDRLRSESTNPDINALKCLQGMRFYTILIVILVHTGLCTLAVSTQNPTFIENFTQGAENFPIVNGLCAIQTFMVITAFLLSYNFQLTIGKGKKFQLKHMVLAFINRYIRLTPCLIVTLALNGTWVYHLGRGPMWDKAVGTEYRNCRKNWWTNILYINNYYDAENMCMQHAWYLATDTQLFIAALVVVGLMWKFQKHVKLILWIFVTIGFAIPGVVSYYNKYDFVVRMYPEAIYEIFLQEPQWHAMYSSSIVNFGAYALGITFGYIFYKKRNTKFFTKKIYVVIWWILVWGLSLGALFSGIPFYQEGVQYSRIGAAIYVVAYRIMFVLGMCTIIYGCTEGIGWFFRDCLTWSPIQILARVTYCTYLVHVVVIRVRAGYARTPKHFTYYTLLSQASGDATVSFIFGTLLALFVELPVSALQKLMVPQLVNKSNLESSEERTDNAEKGKAKEYNQRF